MASVPDTVEARENRSGLTRTSLKEDDLQGDGIVNSCHQLSYPLAKHRVIVPNINPSTQHMFNLPLNMCFLPLGPHVWRQVSPERVPNGIELSQGGGVRAPRLVKHVLRSFQQPRLHILQT